MKSDWEKVKWGDLATLEYGKGIRDYKNKQGKYRVYGTNGPIGWYHEPLYNSEGVIIGRKGAYRGVYFSKDPFYVIDTAFYLKPKKKFNMKWAYYNLKTVDINKIDSGAAIPSTSREAFYQIEVELPPLGEQQKISNILSNYDKLIGNNIRKIQILEEMAKLVYDEWFVKFRFPGYKYSKMIDTELGKIPKGWEIRSLDNLLLKKNDRFKEENAKLPLLDLKNMPRKSLYVDKYGKSDDLETSRIIFNKYDILFGSIRPYLHKVICAKEKGITNTSVFVLESKNKNNLIFNLMTMISENIIQIATAKSQGTKMPVINWNVLKEEKIIFPKANLLDKYNSICYPILEKIFILTTINHNLKITRDLLQTKLIHGDIVVSNLDIKTPKEE